MDQPSSSKHLTVHPVVRDLQPLGLALDRMPSGHSESNYSKASSFAANGEPANVRSYSARKKQSIQQWGAISEPLAQRVAAVKQRLRGVVTFNVLRNEILEFGTSSHLMGITNVYKRGLPSIIENKNLKQQDDEVVEVVKLGCLFHPESPFKQVWNLAMLFLLFYVFIGTPWIIAFEEVEIGSTLFYFELVIDSLFCLDIFITLNSAYVAKETLVTSRWKIFTNYLTGLLLIDIIAIFPFFLFEGSASNNSNSLVRMIRITKVSRIFRASKLLKVLKHIGNVEWMESFMKFARMYDGVTRLLIAGFITLIIGHFVACMWYFSAKLDEFGPDTWAVRKGFADSDKGEAYLASLYWTFTTLTTVGFGDIQGFTSSEMVICILWMLFGIGFYSFLIGTLTSVLSSIDAHNSEVKEHLKNIEVFCDEFKIQKPLQKQMKKDLTEHGISDSLDHDTRLWVLSLVSRKLRQAVCENMNEAAVTCIPFLQKQDFVFLTKVVPRLECQEYGMNLVMYKKNDFAEAIYFVAYGRAGYKIDKKQFIFKEVIQGGWFGEVELIHNCLRRFTVVTRAP